MEFTTGGMAVSVGQVENSIGSNLAAEKRRSSDTCSPAMTVAGSSANTSGSRKRPKKLQRSKTSCLKCRSRKAKCGALPPSTCAYCAKHGFKCVWPSEDGRTARFLNRASSSLGTALEPSPHLTEDEDCPRSQAPRSASDSFATTSTSNPPSGYVGEDPNQNIDNWIVPTPLTWGTSPINNSGGGGGSSAALDFDTNAFIRDIFGLDNQDLQVQLLVNGNGTDKGYDGNLWLSALGDQQATSSHGTACPSTTTGNGVMRIKYRRSHGRTAFVPGTLAVPIKIQLQPRSLSTGNVESASPISLTSPSTNGTHSDPETLKHLIDVFEINMGAQYPCVDCGELRDAIDKDPSATPDFLLNCVAAVSARFSQDPRVAKAGHQPESYGDIYYERANAMLGSVMKIPLRETVIGFLLLACCADSVTGQWMMAGNATRMAIDLGLEQRDSPATDPETARQNRLCFWTVLMLDYMVSLGVGRATSLRPESITQILPTERDIRPSPSPSSNNSQLHDDQGSSSSTQPRSPFPYAVQMMLSYGRLINILNSGNTTKRPGDHTLFDGVRDERVEIMRHYQALPPDMQWSPENLRLHNDHGQASTFFHLHTWIHTVLANSVLPTYDLDLTTAPAPAPATAAASGSSDVLNPGRDDNGTMLGVRSGVLTPMDQLSRWGGKMMVEYLTLCDVMNPAIYYTQPFLGQPLFTAGTVIMSELQPHLRKRAVASASAELDMTSSLLTTLAQGQIDVIRKAITKTGVYWRGSLLVMKALNQCIMGEKERDNIWGENDTYAVEVYDWSLPGKYRADGATVN